MCVCVCTPCCGLMNVYCFTDYFIVVCILQSSRKGTFTHTDVHILGWFYFWKATPTMLLHASNRWQSTRTQPPLIAGYEWFVMKIVHSPCFPSFRCAVHLERKIINNGKRMGIVLVSETHTHTHTARHILHSLDHHRKPSIGLL